MTTTKQTTKDETEVKTQPQQINSRYTKKSIIIFILVGFSLFGIVGYLLEIKSNNQKIATPISEPLKTSDPVNLADFNKQIINSSFSLDMIGEYSKTGQTVSYKCFNNEESDNTDLELIKAKILKNDETLQEACIYNNEAIVSTVNKNSDPNHQASRIKLYIYTRTDDYWFHGENLLNSNQNEVNNFKIIDWDSSNIVYALFEAKFTGTRLHLANIFYYNLENSYEGPKLIESCEYAVGGGTAQRDFTKCISFEHKDISSFMKKDDLP